MVFVGIDVSKDRLDVYVRPLGGGFSVSNEAAGYAAVISRLQPLRTKRIVLEATGGYERALWLALNEAGLVAAPLLKLTMPPRHLLGIRQGLI
jgi:transposase